MSKSRNKRFKCFCNDDRQCPKNDINYINNKKRFCYTETVCLTKKYHRTYDGKKILKYFCDEELHNSIRKNIIEYRDCLVNSSNPSDSEFVEKNSAEYCCNSGDFCNEFLEPIKYIKLVVDQENSNNNHIQGFIPIVNSTNTENSNTNNSNNIFTTLNIIFLNIFFIFALLIILVLVIFLIKRKKRLKRSKKKTHSHLSSLSSTSSGSSTTSSSKSKFTTATSVPIQNCCHFFSEKITEKSSKSENLVMPVENHFYPNKINSLVSNNISQTNLEDNSKKLNEYFNFNKDNHQLITENELFEPLVEQKFPENEILQNDHQYKDISLPLTLGSDFASTGLDSTTSTCLDLSQNTSTSISNTNYNGFEWSGSGSGAGRPQLLPRTIAREIKLIYPCIGKGRFGEVYKGMRRDEFIAVKTFNSADEKSWENECSIYNTSGFRHENILGFIAADNIDRGTYTELWIITDYHHNGSLYDYLNQQGLTPVQTLQMALSIVNGLDHLHTPIESYTGKPALAHCDLKSKNILVKSDLTCCISDLGLALCGDKNGKVTQNPATIRTGTKRYMAPEILDKKINYKSLLQFQKAEMYSLALIFWELLRRTIFELKESNTILEGIEHKKQIIYSYDYKLPYYEYIQADPDELQMKNLVCEQKCRPEVNYLWKKVPILNELTQLTEELWVENADGRLNALRLKKSLNQIKRKYSIE